MLSTHNLNLFQQTPSPKFRLSRSYISTHTHLTFKPDYTNFISIHTSEFPTHPSNKDSHSVQVRSYEQVGCLYRRASLLTAQLNSRARVSFLA
jgi:hypothetical protein